MPATPAQLRITLQQYQYFLAAVQHRSLSAAAEAQKIAQPSLSEQIRRMEKTLGTALFIRTNRELILTDAARTLVPHAQRTIQSANEAQECLKPLTELTSGTITFGAFSTAEYIFYLDLVNAMSQQFPGVKLKLVKQNSIHIADMVREGELECGIVALPVDDRGLEMEPLEWSPQVYYWSTNPEHTATPVDIERLSQSRLVMPEATTGDVDPTRRRILEIAQAKGLKVTNAYDVAPYSAIRIAAAGIADTIASYWLVREVGFENDLHRTSLSPLMRENYAFIKRRNARLSRGTVILQEDLRRILAHIPTDAPTSD